MFENGGNIIIIRVFTVFMYMFGHIKCRYRGRFHKELGLVLGDIQIIAWIVLS